MSSETHDDSDPGDVLETRRVDTAGAVRDSGRIFTTHRTGETLGRYVLLRPVGAGGMSVVWLAFDPELDRQVALKLMHETSRGAATNAQRLLREAQALARLSHANVVHVYDVGIVGGEVYLAMELVDGVTFKEWLAAAPRSVDDILTTLGRAGAGLAAAHDAGLVHLDVKPTNVVVGDDGRVRVVDFGLARPPTETSRRSSDEFAFPRAGRLGERLTEDGSVLGTPGYIAPEVLRGRAADGRADQFSFCVTAWEALFGERPFASDPNDPRAGVTGRLRPLPARGAALVARPIRTALMRGLATDPDERFASMRALLDAIRPRHTTRRAGAAALVVLGGAGLVVAGTRWGEATPDPCAVEASALVEVWNPTRSEALRQAFVATSAPFAEDAWTTAARVVDVHAQAWTRGARDACEAREVRAEQSATTYELRRACLADARSKLEELLALFAAADAHVVERAVTAAVGIGDPTACADVERLHAEASLPTDPELRARVEELHRASLRARVLVDAGRFEQASQMVGALVPEARALQHAPTLARLLQARAGALGAAGDPGAAAELLEEALVLAESAGLDELRFAIYADLAYAVGHQLRDARRGAYFADAAKSLHARIGGTSNQLMRLLVTRGVLATGVGDYDAALQLFSEALAIAPAQDPDLPSVLLDVGGVHYEYGNFAVALEFYQRAYELYLAQLGPSHPSIAVALENRGNSQQAMGNFDAALADHERSIAILEAAGVTDGLSFALQLNNVGVVLSGMQRFTDAVAYYERARGVLRANHGEHVLGSILLTNLGEARLAQGRPEEALGLYRSAMGHLESVLGPEHPYVGVALTGLGLAQLELGERDAARGHFARALSIHARGGDPVQRAETELGLARAIVESASVGEFDAARAYAVRAREAFVAAGDRGAGQRERVDALLARIDAPR